MWEGGSRTAPLNAPRHQVHGMTACPSASSSNPLQITHSGSPHRKDTDTHEKKTTTKDVPSSQEETFRQSTLVRPGANQAAKKQVLFKSTNVAHREEGR